MLKDNIQELPILTTAHYIWHYTPVEEYESIIEDDLGEMNHIFEDCGSYNFKDEKKTIISQIVVIMEKL